jgi:hypothetical protein
MSKLSAMVFFFSVCACTDVTDQPDMDNSVLNVRGILSRRYTRSGSQSFIFMIKNIKSYSHCSPGSTSIYS